MKNNLYLATVRFSNRTVLRKFVFTTEEEINTTLSRVVHHDASTIYINRMVVFLNNVNGLTVRKIF